MRNHASSSLRSSPLRKRRVQSLTGIDPDVLARFLIETFHGLLLQRESDDRFSVEPRKVLSNAPLQAPIGSRNSTALEVVVQ